MSRNSTHINCNQIAGTVNQGIWLNDCDPCAECAHTIPNLQQWLRQKFEITAGGVAYALPADTATIGDGTAVSQWNDEIGSNNAVQATGANQPTWDTPNNTLTFDNTDSLTFTNTVYAAGDDFTIILGFLVDGAGTFPYALWNGDSGNDSIAITSNTEVQIVLDGTSQTITGPAIAPSTGQCDMLNWVLRRKNDTCQLFLGGVAWGPSFMWAGNYEVDTIGFDPIGGSGLNGDVTNFMQFDRDLTDKEIWCLECYFCGDDTEEECVGCRIDEFKLNCHGETDGTLTAVMTGATGGAVTYAWSPGGQTTQTISTLGAGAYTCVMTDVGGTGLSTTCVGDVVEPTIPFSCTVTGVDPYFSTAPVVLMPGSVNVVTVGGWGSTNTYTWTVPAGAAAIGNVASAAVTEPGTYSVSVVNSEGCTTTCQVLIQLERAPTLDIKCCIESPLCHDDPVAWHIMMDSSAVFACTIDVSGSVSGSPAWSPITVPALPADTTFEVCDPHTGPWVSSTGAQLIAPDETWTFVVTDSTSGTPRTDTCTSAAINPPELTITATVVQPTYCQNGYTNGTITGNGVGGYGSLTYSIEQTLPASNTWANTQSLSSVDPGTYIITVTDSHGCTASVTVVIECPMDPMPTIDVVVTPELCREEGPTGGSCDGTATFTPSVQSYTGYTFTLNVYDPGGTLFHTTGPIATFPSPHVITGLCPGIYTYSYVATDAAMVDTSIANTTFEILPATAYWCTHTETQISCVGATASITVTTNGGAPAWTIAWTGPNSYTANTFTITGLTDVGLYYYVATDANGCQCSGSVYIKDGCTFDATLFADPIDCTPTNSTTEYLVNGILDLNTIGTGATNIYNDPQFQAGLVGLMDDFFDAANYTSATGFHSTGMWYTYETNTVGTNMTLTHTTGTPNMLCGEPVWGMAQKVQGLTIGNTYTIEVIIDPASFTAGDEWDVKMYADNGTAFVAAAFATGTNPLTTSGLHTLTFVATAVDMEFTLNYDGAAPGSSTTAGWNRLFDQTNDMKIAGGYNQNTPQLKGKAVAMSSNGRRILIGSPGHLASGANIGKVRSFDLCCPNGLSDVYPYVGCQWAASGNLVMQAAESGDMIGDRHGIDISHDGNTAVVGNPFSEQQNYGAAANADFGKVVVFGYTQTNAASCAGSWEMKGNAIMNPNYGAAGHENERFGQAVAISGDGLTVVVGAPGFDGAAGVPGTGGVNDNYGKVFLYRYFSGTWTQLGTEVMSLAGNFDEWGFSVALSDDGNEFVMGGPGQHGDGGADADSGAMKVYENVGGAWVAMGTEIDGEAENEFFGKSVAMSGDGQRVVGCTMLDPTTGGAQASGTCRVYDYNGSAWVKVGADISGIVNNGQSGCSVDMSTDGSTIVIGAAQEDTNDQGATASNAGSVRVYKDVSGTWTLQGNDINGENTGDMFGFDVACNGDGTMFVSGAPFNNGNVPGTAIAGLNGAAYIYEMTSESNGQIGNGCVTYMSLTGQNPLANTTDITATLTPCGDAPFTYAWVASLGGSLGSNAANASSLIGVGAGTYTVVIQDASTPPCETTEVIVIAPAGVVTNSITVVSNVLCDGTLGALESDNQFPGGTYLWTTDAAFTLPVTGSSTGYQTYEIDNQPAGTYYLQIVTVDGCVWEGSAIITDAGPGFTLDAVVVDADMCNDCCGSIVLTVTGGTGPFTFLWTGPGGPYTTQDLDCLQPGSYTVTVTDDNGCEETGTWTVGIANDPINFQLQVNATAGTISTINLSGGTPNYNWVWTGPGGFTASGSAVSAVIPNISPVGNGLYCLTVTDSFSPPCEVTHCIDWIYSDPILGYNCVQNAEDSCKIDLCDIIYGDPQGGSASSGGERAGWMQDISGDGSTIAIGAPNCIGGGEGPGPDDPQEMSKNSREYYSTNNSPQSNAGKVEVWMIGCGEVKSVQKGQTLFGPKAGARFGYSVALSTDGNKLTVGAPGAGAAGGGGTYHFIYSSGTWIPKAMFESPNAGDRLGNCVSQSGTSLHFVSVSSNYDNGKGAVQVYETNGFVWTNSGNQILGGGSGYGTNTNESLECAAISDDGTRIIVGAGQEETHVNVSGTYYNSRGLARCYLNVSGTWTQVGSDFVGDYNTHTGTSVSISHDGLTVAISSPSESNNTMGLFTAEGAVRVYTASSAATSATWNQIGNTIYGEDSYEYSGSATSWGADGGAVGIKLSSDGETIIVGSQSHDNPNQTGAATVYKLIDGAWVKQCDTILGTNHQDAFGCSVSISDAGARVSAGANNFTYQNKPSTGKVRIHDMTYTTGSTPELVTDGVDFTTLNNNSHTTGAATTTAMAIIWGSAVNNQWYTFGPDGSSNSYALAPTPTPSGGEFELSMHGGVSQRITGLTVGHIYDITVTAGPMNDPCVGQNVGMLQVFVGGSSETLTSPTGFSGIAFQYSCDGVKTIQYTATATTVDLVVYDGASGLNISGCDWNVLNISMKQAQYQCDECKQAPCDFPTLQLCLDEPCGGDPIAASWDCKDGTCYDPGTGNGQFSTLQACNDTDCGTRSERWDCTDQGCQTTAGGTYPDFASCNAACIGPSRTYYCEILCSTDKSAQKYKDDKSREEEGRYKGERKREDVQYGGRCRVVTGSESPAIAAELQYDDPKKCLENCPWCKRGDERR